MPNTVSTQKIDEPKVAEKPLIKLNEEQANSILKNDTLEDSKENSKVVTEKEKLELVPDQPKISEEKFLPFLNTAEDKKTEEPKDVTTEFTSEELPATEPRLLSSPTVREETKPIEQTLISSSSVAEEPNQAKEELISDDRKDEPVKLILDEPKPIEETLVPSSTVTDEPNKAKEELVLEVPHAAEEKCLPSTIFSEELKEKTVESISDKPKHMEEALVSSSSVAENLNQAKEELVNEEQTDEPVELILEEPKPTEEKLISSDTLVEDSSKPNKELILDHSKDAKSALIIDEPKPIEETLISSSTVIDEPKKVKEELVSDERKDEPAKLILDEPKDAKSALISTEPKPIEESLVPSSSVAEELNQAKEELIHEQKDEPVELILDEPKPIEETLVSSEEQHKAKEELVSDEPKSIEEALISSSTVIEELKEGKQEFIPEEEHVELILNEPKVPESNLTQNIIVDGEQLNSDCLQLVKDAVLEDSNDQNLEKLELKSEEELTTKTKIDKEITNKSLTPNNSVTDETETVGKNNFDELNADGMKQLGNLIENIQKNLVEDAALPVEIESKNESEEEREAEALNNIQVSIPLIEDMVKILNNIENDISEKEAQPDEQTITTVEGINEVKTEIEKSDLQETVDKQSEKKSKKSKHVKFNLDEAQEIKIAEAEALFDDRVSDEEIVVDGEMEKPIEEDFAMQDDVFESSYVLENLEEENSKVDDIKFLDEASKLLENIENNIKNDLLSSVENLSASISDSVASLEFISNENAGSEDKNADVNVALLSIIQDIQPTLVSKPDDIVKVDEDFMISERTRTDEIEAAFDIENIPAEIEKQVDENQIQDTYDIVSISSVEGKRESSFDELKDENESKSNDEIVNIVIATNLEVTEDALSDEKLPIFTQKLNNAVFKVGDNIHLDCFVTGAKPIDVKWYKNDASISNTDKNIEIYRELGVCSLEIASAKISDQGAYACIATNEFGENKTIGILECAVMDEDIHFIETLKDQEVEENSEVYLDCSVHGYKNNLSINWFFNDLQIANLNEQIEILQEAGICSLQIRSMRNELEGIYKCTVNDSNNEIIDETKCHIRCKVSTMQTEKIRSFSRLPEFVNDLNGKTIVREGETLSLVCRLNDDCEPKPLVQWFQNRQNVEDCNFKSLQMKYTPKTGECRLVIDDCTKDCSGDFLCAACDDNFNVIAVTSSKVRVFAKDEEIVESADESADEEYKGIPPLFLQIPESLDLEEGENVEFKCQVMGEPLPNIKWYHTKQLDGDSELNELNDESFKFNPETGIVILEIRNIRRDSHEGVYIVRAENLAGSLTQICHLKINEKRYPILDKASEHAPKFLVNLPERMTAMDGDHVSFVCICSGNPEPEILWLRDTKQANTFGPLNINNDVKINYDPLTGKCSMQIVDLFPQDTGVYLCRAKNKHGIAETHSQLNVECKFFESLKLQIIFNFFSNIKILKIFFKHFNTIKIVI